MSYTTCIVVVGCVDIKPRPGVTITRNGNNAVLQCDATGETWTATCQGGDWVEQNAPDCHTVASGKGMSNVLELLTKPSYFYVELNIHQHNLQLLAKKIVWLIWGYHELFREPPCILLDIQVLHCLP